jgi:serine/threonine protein kinase
MQIRHPHIVRAYAFGRWPHPVLGHPYLLMDYVDGLPLHEWRQQKAPSFRQVFEVISLMAQTLDALDDAEIRHRDVKGSNILVRSSDGKPVLVDFGSAHYSLAVSLTNSALPPGTPHYRTPEALRFYREHYQDPTAHYSFRLTDELYALGVAFYELLAGRAPFSPDLPREILFAEIERRVPPAPSTFDPRISPAMDRIVLQLLEKKPEARFQLGQELNEDLQACVRDSGALMDERVQVRPLDLITTDQEV